MPIVEALQETPLSAVSISDEAPETPANCLENHSDEIHDDIKDEIKDEIKGEIGRETTPEASPCNGAEERRSELEPEQAADAGVRMQRLKEIQSALADGTYQVSASDVAAKLITQLLRK